MALSSLPRNIVENGVDRRYLIISTYANTLTRTRARMHVHARTRQHPRKLRC